MFSRLSIKRLGFFKLITLTSKDLLQNVFQLLELSLLQIFYFKEISD